MAGIYIHIPFCKQKCSYCNFHFSTQLQGKNDIQQALLKELDLRQEEIAMQPIETIYLGGGTPSLWSPEELVQLFTKVQSINLDKNLEEITIECNPDDLTEDYLRDLKTHTPVNRISIGIQSFHEDDLLLMNRSHNSSEARSALENIFKAGFDEVSADLIFGLPDSDTIKWRDNLKIITEYPIHHVSCYNLTIEDKTVFKHQLEHGKITVPDDEATIDQFYMARDFFSSRGFLHYEISNYARPDHLALHNTNYWKNVPYIGIGPSAHSYDGYRRRWNVANNQKYIKEVSAGNVYWENEELSEKDRYNEYIMTGLRTVWGIESTLIETFSMPIQKEFYKLLDQEMKKGNVERKDSAYRLTTSGLAIADQIMSEFFYL
ncbi:radical SAM family heme chaperone HemW [Membranicola marinus]|uniref:Heme chaperone HemW n=1 Tax=Membranihabitans marinus TaxID=1227546 RepID=A0A953LB97_9BACT|nr:radical SAM family heme chaperone HemW [Membranihabitans marinus]MBY5958361.1 radical SAM family heme chaperone HemW [Membranihabitans marinus]